VLSGPHLMGFFTSDAIILATAGHLFMLSLILEPGRTFNIIVISSLRATGDARFPFRMALLSMWGIAIPIAYLCGIHWGWGLVGVWCGFVVDEWVRCFGAGVVGVGKKKCWCRKPHQPIRHTSAISHGININALVG